MQEWEIWAQCKRRYKRYCEAENNTMIPNKQKFLGILMVVLFWAAVWTGGSIVLLYLYLTYMYPLTHGM
jgi:hypothetical protein